MTFAADQKERLDVFLVRMMPHHSRTKIAKMIEAEGVMVEGALIHKTGFMLHNGFEVECEEPVETPPQAVEPVAMDLDIRYEDEHLLVINKPRGLAVHPAPGLHEPTLVHGLLARSHELSTHGGSFRPGIVHRLDKDTTGLMFVAKNDAAHRGLAEQIQTRVAQRRYFCIGWGDPTHDKFTVNAPIGRNQQNHLIMAIVSDGRASVTHFQKIGRADKGTVLVCRLETGRTHQIRIHLTFAGMPIRGDRLYSKGPWAEGVLQLHAGFLAFKHPVTGEQISVYAEPPDDFLEQAICTEASIRD